MDCEWCDTEYARKGESTTVELEQLVSICRANGVPRVILTGGEPLLQEELPELCRVLLEDGFDVQVETSGTRLVDKLDKRVIKIVDIKPPRLKSEKRFPLGEPRPARQTGPGEIRAGRPGGLRMGAGNYRQGKAGKNLRYFIFGCSRTARSIRPGVMDDRRPAAGQIAAPTTQANLAR